MSSPEGIERLWTTPIHPIAEKLAWRGTIER
jgi:hypothetical protein